MSTCTYCLQTRHCKCKALCDDCQKAKELYEHVLDARHKKRNRSRSPLRVSRPLSPLPIDPRSLIDARGAEKRSKSPPILTTSSPNRKLNKPTKYQIFTVIV